ncbi:hypothetical protein AB0K05_15470 [Nonomuraea sp. NPDC049486]|uniref:hypothetical protein n=1 Tax=Nonomuraea sp. NPDC049486 TaxID=3155773 RepID=UPI0034401A32
MTLRFRWTDILALLSAARNVVYADSTDSTRRHIRATAYTHLTMVLISRAA